METLGPDLNYPTETRRALGVRLAQELDAESGLAWRIKDELNDWEALSNMDELGVLRRFVGLDQYELVDIAAKLAKASRSGAGYAGKTKATFDRRTRQGRAGQGEVPRSDGTVRDYDRP
jgi:hypothetical protein